MNKQDRLKRTMLLLAAALGIICFPKLSSLYLFLFLVFSICYFIRRFESKDRDFLIRLVILIFVSRFILSLAVSCIKGGELSQDEGLYSKKALLLVFKNMGHERLEECFNVYFHDYDMVNVNYGFNSYTYLISGFYRYFGYQTHAVRLVNSIIAILASIAFFYLARDLFGSRIAKVSSVVFSFLPSLLYWSVLAGVDEFVICNIIIFVLLLNRFLIRPGISILVAMTISAILVQSIRVHVTLILLGAAIMAVCVKIFLMMTKRGKVICLIFLFLLSFLASPIIREYSHMAEGKFKCMVSFQLGFASADDSGYMIYPENWYKGDFRDLGINGFLGAYLKGISYVLFSPFPWKIESALQLIAYPQVILLYILYPFALIGLLWGIRSQTVITSGIFFIVFTLCSIFALVHGNVGALFRHKDMMVPFVILYSTVGIARVFGLTDRIEPGR